MFFIDPKGIMRAMIYYPKSLGRNFDEIKRVIQALQKADADKCVTPADWRPGQDVIVPGVQSDVKSRSKVAPGELYSLRWYLTFRRESGRSAARSTSKKVLGKRAVKKKQ